MNVFFLNNLHCIFYSIVLQFVLYNCNLLFYYERINHYSGVKKAMIFLVFTAERIKKNRVQYMLVNSMG